MAGLLAGERRAAGLAGAGEGAVVPRAPMVDGRPLILARHLICPFLIELSVSSHLSGGAKGKLPDGVSCPTDRFHGLRELGVIN